MSENNIKVNVVSKPFIVSAVIFVFAGSIIGATWMMSLLGAEGVGIAHTSFSLHKTFQVDGFLTLLIMGIGYMIVPRFRNIQLSSSRWAYLSFLLIIFSISVSVVSAFTNESFLLLGSFAQFLGVSIFCSIMIWTLRIHPRLLRTADYFIGLSVLVLLAISLFDLIPGIIDLIGGGRILQDERSENGNVLSEAQMLLLFAILMIFGIEYKTLPSFLGFIKPRKKMSIVSICLGIASVILGLSSMIHKEILLAIIFNIVMLIFVLIFATSVYIFGGFDNREILRIIQGERKARYTYIIRHLRLAFIFLFAGIILAAAFNISEGFVLYDLAIHYVAIGFIGITIALYLPLMLPPITGRMVHFTNFNLLPLLFVVAALAIRTLGDSVMTTTLASVSYFFMVSGWLIVAALFTFVTMIHRSMKHDEKINEQ